MSKAPTVGLGPRAAFAAAPLRFALLVSTALAQVGIALALLLAVRQVALGNSSLHWLAVGIALIVLVGAALRGRERFDAEALGQAYVHSIRLAMFRRLLKMSPRSVSAQPRGSYVVRFVGDLAAIKNWITQGLAALISSTLVLLAGTAMLYAIAPVFGIAILVVSALTAAAAWWLANPLADANRVLRSRRGQLARFVSELLHATSAVQVHGQQKRESRRLARRGERVIGAARHRAAIIGLVRAISELAGYGLFIGVLIGGAATMSTVELLPALAIVSWLLGPIRQLGRVFEFWQSARVGRERIRFFFSRPIQPAVREPRRPRWSSTAVEYQNLVLFQGAQPVSAKIAPKARVAIVGPNGSGKSSLLAATAGLVEPQSGVIRIGGRTLGRIARRRLSRSVVLAAPDVPFLRGSLRRNLSYGGDRMSDLDFRRMLLRLRLSHLIASQPDSSRYLQEAGSNLSSGERQRLALGRALWADPHVLLLDEVDAHLDETSLAVLCDEIDRFEGTVIVATHNQQLLALADHQLTLPDAIASAKPATGTSS
ncbi:MAG: ABC transporter ATP-binding protein [Pseudomonadota bacterium]